MPDPVDEVLERVSASWADGDFDSVRRACREIMERDDAPAHFRSYAALRLAQSFMAVDDFSGALAVWEEIISRPDYPGVHRYEAEQMAEETRRRKEGLEPRPRGAARTRVEPVETFAVEIHVAPDGDDRQGDGSRRRPFATLRRARDELRERGDADGPAGVFLAPGEYVVTEPLVLDDRDSGTADAPVVYRSTEQGAAVLYGGRRLRGFEPVTDPEILQRLPEDSRDKVYQCDLREQGIEDYGELKMRGGIGMGASPPALELYFNGEPMTLARWPNEGFVEARELVDPGSVDEGRPAVLGYDSERHERWVEAEDPWIFGFFRRLWADAQMPVGDIDPEAQTITTAKPYSYGDMSDRQGIIYYAFNLLEELERPGEWYLNRDTGVLYFYPPSDPQEATVEIGMLSELMLDVDGASEIRFEGLVFDLARHNGIRVSGSENILFAGCTVRRMAGNGITIRGGRGNGLFGCDIHTIGRRGAEVEGGDRKSLRPGEHFVENCRIYSVGRIDRTYVPGVQLGGVGNRVAFNLMYDAPSTITHVSGNDHVFEYNEIHSVVTESDDQGAIDMWGNPVYRGNVFRYNYFHNIGKTGDELSVVGQAAIRFDAPISGQLVYGNVFENSSRGHFGAVMIHTGRDNVIDNNVFYNCLFGMSGRWNPNIRHWQPFRDGTRSDHQESELHLSRYPELEHMFDDQGINHMWRNVFYDCGRIVRVSLEHFDSMANHVFGADDDPGFVDARAGDFRLREDAPLFDKMGFRPIPFEEIGLYEHVFRASWPVETEPADLPDWRTDFSERDTRPHPAEPLKAVRTAGWPLERSHEMAFERWPGEPVEVAETPGREPIRSEPAVARLAHDGEHLLVAVRVPAELEALSRGTKWGQDDGMEICLRRKMGEDGRRHPTFVFNGFTEGTVRANPVLFSQAARVEAAAKSVDYSAELQEGQGAWIGRWVIPFEALDIDYEPGTRLEFNIGLRRSCSPPGGGRWTALAGTLSANHMVAQAARLILE